MRRRAACLAAMLLIAGDAGAATTPRLRGVVEGYYGRPWTGAARRDVIGFLGTHGLNAFVYGPKNDPFHRDRWREPYPTDALDDLSATALAARRAHVRFVYALSPGLDVCYGCAADFAALTAKLRQIGRAGVRRFALFFDDAPQTLALPSDVVRYGGDDAAALARAQADLVNRTGRWLRAHRVGGLALVVPTDYAGTDCHPYHGELARRLRRGIPVGWTGPGVLSTAVTGAQARARAACLPGHPVVLWDNYPVNDTVLSINLHLGPLTGRSPDLPAALRGHLFNPMTQAHASLVALGTAGAYLRNPQRYDPDAAWAATLAELAPHEGLAVLAQNTRSSALDLADARALARVVDDLTAMYTGPDWTPAVAALDAEEARQAGAPAGIDADLAGSTLGAEIAPWVTELAAHAARGIDAGRLLRALKPDFFADLAAELAGGFLHVRGRAVPPDATTAAALGPGFAAEAVAVAARVAAPDVVGYTSCLGDLLGADIRFCPTFGLNVHGKALFFLIRSTTEIDLVTDRNVHDRLIRLVGRLYADWAARRTPSADTLTVTLDGTTLALGAANAFEATVPAPASGRARLIVTTAAGEATARAVP